MESGRESIRFSTEEHASSRNLTRSTNCCGKCDSDGTRLKAREMSKENPQRRCRSGLGIPEDSNGTRSGGRTESSAPEAPQPQLDLLFENGNDERSRNDDLVHRPQVRVRHHDQRRRIRKRESTADQWGVRKLSVDDDGSRHSLGPFAMLPFAKIVDRPGDVGSKMHVEDLGQLLRQGDRTIVLGDDEKR